MGNNEGRVRDAARDSMARSAGKKNLRTIILWTAALILGAIFGSMQVPQINEFFNFVATVFTRLFQFIAVPVIALAVITTLASLGAQKETGRIFGHAVCYPLATTIAAAAVALVRRPCPVPERRWRTICRGAAARSPRRRATSTEICP